MSKHLPLREAVLSWLEHAHHLSPHPHAITDEALTDLPEWEALEEAVFTAAPRDEHPDLYAKINGDRILNYRTLLAESSLGAATRLIAQGTDVPESEVADSFVAFCAHPHPFPSDGCSSTATSPGERGSDWGSTPCRPSPRTPSAR
ncbi:hypothetical protein [Streptomyces anulatus]|uniref:hypothetical protein n=1 Tax=Streptomyces anulatus TaxID=1892 RepID=UPI003324B42D